MQRSKGYLYFQTVMGLVLLGFWLTQSRELGAVTYVLAGYLVAIIGTEWWDYRLANVLDEYEDRRVAAGAGELRGFKRHASGWSRRWLCPARILWPWPAPVMMAGVVVAVAGAWQSDGETSVALWITGPTLIAGAVAAVWLARGKWAPSARALRAAALTANQVDRERLIGTALASDPDLHPDVRTQTEGVVRVPSDPPPPL